MLWVLGAFVAAAVIFGALALGHSGDINSKRKDN